MVVALEDKTRALQLEIEELTEKRNAVILAHNYQLPEIQKVADFVGDSLELARKASYLENYDYIIFCGVLFMAETASILSPDSKVVLPEKSAGCPLADMITAQDVENLREEYPGVPVVSYVNTSAKVKAYSDICCTSSNAVKVIESLGSDKAIFLPDRNLARYVSRETFVQIVPWDGFCPTHERFKPEDVSLARKTYPEAVIVVHPECKEEVQIDADFIRSTGGMVRLPEQIEEREFVVGTETGMLYRLQSEYSHKIFYPLSERAICPNMKKTNLKSLLFALQTGQPIIKVEDNIAAKARLSIERMIEIR